MDTSQLGYWLLTINLHQKRISDLFCPFETAELSDPFVDPKIVENPVKLFDVLRARISLKLNCAKSSNNQCSTLQFLVRLLFFVQGQSHCHFCFKLFKVYDKGDTAILAREKIQSVMNLALKNQRFIFLSD